MVQVNKVLYPTDFSDLSLHAVPYVKEYCRVYGAELHVLHVVDEAFAYWMTMGPNSLPVGPSVQEMLTGAKETMQSFTQKHFSDVAESAVRTSVVSGRPFLEILKYAKDQSIDLVVLATHGRGALAHALIGSVAEKVVRKAPCPVLTIRVPGHGYVIP